jgi:hypothetical protein
MARVKKMELCVGMLSFIESSALDRKDSIIFAPGDQHGRLLFAEKLLPIGIGIRACRASTVAVPMITSLM